jgi:uncharacterized damage-inducible protein DinB
MITTDYARAMAAYNRWQNRSLYREADALSDAERKQQCGAFFGSIHGTLSHLLFGDQVWMHRFAGTPAPKAKSIPESVGAVPDWDDPKRQRVAFDETIIDWAERMDPQWLAGDLTWYSGAMGRELTKPPGAAGGSHVQPPDSPSRPGALPADPVQAQAGRHRPAVHASLTQGIEIIRSRIREPASLLVTPT